MRRSKAPPSASMRKDRRRTCARWVTPHLPRCCMTSSCAPHRAAAEQHMSPPACCRFRFAPSIGLKGSGNGKHPIQIRRPSIIVKIDPLEIAFTLSTLARLRTLRSDLIDPTVAVYNVRARASCHVPCSRHCTPRGDSSWTSVMRMEGAAWLINHLLHCSQRYVLTSLSVTPQRTWFASTSQPACLL